MGQFLLAPLTKAATKLSQRESNLGSLFNPVLSQSEAVSMSNAEDTTQRNSDKEVKHQQLTGEKSQLLPGIIITSYTMNRRNTNPKVYRQYFGMAGNTSSHYLTSPEFIVQRKMVNFQRISQYTNWKHNKSRLI